MSDAHLYKAKIIPVELVYFFISWIILMLQIILHKGTDFRLC